jgi:hypothetical protein
MDVLGIWLLDQHHSVRADRQASPAEALDDSGAVLLWKAFGTVVNDNEIVAAAAHLGKRDSGEFPGAAGGIMSWIYDRLRHV